MHPTDVAGSAAWAAAFGRPATAGPGHTCPQPKTPLTKEAWHAMGMNLQPLGDRVIVEPIEQEEMTASGIVLPESAKERPQRGTVLAIGPGRLDDEGEKRIAMDVKVGDVVLYAQYSGTQFKIDDKKYLVLSEKDILARVAS